MMHEIGIVCVAVFLLGYLAYVFKQPIIPAYIIGGLIIGPIALKLIHDPQGIASLSELTIIFVMFLIGLEMDVRKLKAIGPVVSIGAFLQVIVTAILGAVIARFWFNTETSIYIGLFFSFGSTMLAVKLMADEKQTETLNGRIALGILLMQDIIAIIILSVLASKEFSTTVILGTGLKSFGIVAIAIVTGQYLFPKLFRNVAKNPDLMTPVSIGICFVFAFLAENQGLSASIGAFVTGVSLANLPYSLDLTSRVKTLRDFFMPIFFASLGLQLTIPGVNVILPIVVLSLACIFLKPILISVLIARFGYQPRTSFLVGETLMPVSEFGLIIVGVGLSLGHLDSSILTVAMAVMMISMLVSSYVRGDSLYQHISKLVNILDRVGPDVKEEDELSSDGEVYDAILIGCHRIGRHVLEHLCNIYSFKIIEIEPTRLEQLKSMGYHCVYGDMADPGVWERIGDLSKIKLVICTISDINQNLRLIRLIRETAPDLPIFVTTDHIEEAVELYEAGASKVICAHLMAGRLIETGTADIFDLSQLETEKAEDLRAIQAIGQKWIIRGCSLPNNRN